MIIKLILLILYTEALVLLIYTESKVVKLIWFCIMLMTAIVFVIYKVYLVG